MAIAATHLATQGDTSNTSTYTTASIAPAANRWVFVFGVSSGTNPAPFGVVTGLGLNWTTVYSNVGAKTQWLASAYTGASAPTPGTLTVTHSTNITGLAYSIVAVADADATTPIVQMNHSRTSAASQTVTLTDAMSSASNATLAMFWNQVGETMTPGGSYIELGEASHNAPLTAIQTEWLLPGTTTPSVTWSTSSSGGGIATELAAGATSTAATGTASLTLTATGTAAAAATGTASLSLTATGTGQAAAAGTATLALSATGTAASGGGGGPDTITVNHLATAGDSGNLSTYTTTSIAPAANRLVLVFGVTSGTNPAPVGTVSGLGLTWIPYNDNAGAKTQWVAYAVTGSSAPTPGTLSISHGAAQTGLAYSIVEIGGYDAASPVLQTERARGTGTGATITLPSPISTPTNATVAMFWNSIAEAITPVGSYVELGEATHTAPTTQIQTQWLLPGTTTPSATWPTSAMGGGLAVEVKSGTLAGGGGAATGTATLQLTATASATGPGNPDPIVPTLLTEGSGTADTTSYATASITPTANRVLLAFVSSSTTNNTNTEPTTVTGNGLTWTRVTGVSGNTNNTSSLWWAPTGATPSAGAVTFGFGVAQHNVLWKVVEVNADPAAPVAQARTHAISGANIYVTLDEEVAAGNATFGFASMNSAIVTLTPITGYTEIGTQVTETSPAIRHALEWRQSGTVSLGFTGTGTPSKSMIGAEVQAALVQAGSAATGTATLALTAAGTARAAATGTATLALTAAGAARAAATGTAALTLTAAGTGRAVATGSAALTLTAAGTARAPATGTATLTLTATGTGRGRATGTATLALTATGQATSPGGATGTATLALTAAGTARAAATGTATVTLSGTAAARGAGAGTATLLLSGTAAPAGAAQSTGTLQLVGTGTLAAQAASEALLTLTALGLAGGTVTNVDISVEIGPTRVTTTLVGVTRDRRQASVATTRAATSAIIDTSSRNSLDVEASRITRGE